MNLTQNFVNSFCSNVYQTASGQIQKASQIFNLQTLANALDIFNVQGIMDACNDTSSSNGALDCAKNVMAGVANWDPTGLLTIATAFVYPECTVTTEVIPDVYNPTSPPGPVYVPPPPNYLEVKDSISRVEDVEDGCIILYPECDFKGTGYKLCYRMKEYFPTLGEYNNKISSFITGKNIQGALYQGQNKSGLYLIFGAENPVKCLKDFDTDEFKINKNSQSLYLMRKDCVFVSCQKDGDTWNGSKVTTRHICGPNYGMYPTGGCKFFKMEMLHNDLKLQYTRPGAPGSFLYIIGTTGWLSGNEILPYYKMESIYFAENK